MARSGETISVQEAALALGVTERSVLNLLKSGKLKGEKAGKFWKIRRESLLTCVEKGSEKKASGPVNPPVWAAPSTPAAATFEAVSERRGGKGHKLASLRAFELAQDILWKDPAAHRLFSLEQSGHLGCYPDRSRLDSLRASIIEEIGAGFVSYGVQKEAAYGRARAVLGRLMAALELRVQATLNPRGSSADLLSVQRRLEEEFLPALVALHRVVSRRKGRGE